MGMTGREKQWGEGVLSAERRVGRTVNKEPFMGGENLVNYNQPSVLTDV